VEVEIYFDELSKVAVPFDWPERYTMVEALLRDSAYSFIDNINTPNRETTSDVVMAAFKKSCARFIKS
jgi:penicillin amidase